MGRLIGSCIYSFCSVRPPPPLSDPSPTPPLPVNHHHHRISSNLIDFHRISADSAIPQLPRLYLGSTSAAHVYFLGFSRKRDTLRVSENFRFFGKSRFVVFGVPGRASGGVWESRIEDFTKSAKKCLGANRGPILTCKTRDNFARSRSRCGFGTIFRNNRAFYTSKWVPDLPRGAF